MPRTRKESKHSPAAPHHTPLYSVAAVINAVSLILPSLIALFIWRLSAASSRLGKTWTWAQNISRLSATGGRSIYHHLCTQTTILPHEPKPMTLPPTNLLLTRPRPPSQAWLTIDDYINYTRCAIVSASRTSWVGDLPIWLLSPGRLVLLGVYELVGVLLRRVAVSVACEGDAGGSGCDDRLGRTLISCHALINTFAVRSFALRAMSAFGDGRDGHVVDRVLSGLAALMWCIHPARAETVLWKSASGYTFGLPFALEFLKVELADEKVRGGGGRPLYSLVMYWCAVFCKPVFVSLPICRLVLAASLGRSNNPFLTVSKTLNTNVVSRLGCSACMVLAALIAKWANHRTGTSSLEEPRVTSDVAGTLDFLGEPRPWIGALGHVII